MMKDHSPYRSGLIEMQDELDPEKAALIESLVDRRINERLSAASTNTSSDETDGLTSLRDILGLLGGAGIGSLLGGTTQTAVAASGQFRSTGSQSEAAAVDGERAYDMEVSRVTTKRMTTDELVVGNDGPLFF